VSSHRNIEALQLRHGYGVENQEMVQTGQDMYFQEIHSLLRLQWRTVELRQVIEQPIASPGVRFSSSHRET
jgi:hypothetical protein